MCFNHFAGGSKDGEIEHERPRVFSNELNMAEIEEQIGLISHLHPTGVKTTDIHKALPVPGKGLGDLGKQKVGGRVSNTTGTTRRMSNS